MPDHIDVADSVPLDAPPPAAKSRPLPKLRVGNLKLILALFLIFMTVVSDMFTNSVIAGFGEKAVRGRSPTSWGVVLQGVFLVIFYIIAIYLMTNNIL